MQSLSHAELRKLGVMMENFMRSPVSNQKAAGGCERLRAKIVQSFLRRQTILGVFPPADERSFWESLLVWANFNPYFGAPIFSRMKTIAKAFWLFGRSGAGKTTLAQRLRTSLLDRNLPVVCLDGDEMRSTLCSDLGFKSEARLENHRRIAEIARLLNNQDLNVVVATMAPEHLHRDTVAKILGQHLVWFYIHAPLDVCIERDPKGLYKRALAGQIQQLTNYPFEPPRPAERENYINTVTQDIAGCHQQMLETVRTHLQDFTI